MMTHDRYIAIETRIGVVLNAIVGGAFVFLMFGGLANVGLWGMQGLAFDLLPTTFMISLMMTIGLTLMTRSRVQKGKIGPTAYNRRLPTNVILRGLTLAIIMTLLLVPLSIGLLMLLWTVTGDWPFLIVLGFKSAFSVLIGVVLTPVILRAAFNDGFKT